MGFKGTCPFLSNFIGKETEGKVSELQSGLRLWLGFHERAQKTCSPWWLILWLIIKAQGPTFYLVEDRRTQNDTALLSGALW